MSQNSPETGLVHIDKSRLPSSLRKRLIAKGIRTIYERALTVESLLRRVKDLTPRELFRIVNLMRRHSTRFRKNDRTTYITPDPYKRLVDEVLLAALWERRIRTWKQLAQRFTLWELVSLIRTLMERELNPTNKEKFGIRVDVLEGRVRAIVQKLESLNLRLRVDAKALESIPYLTFTDVLQWYAGYRVRTIEDVVRNRGRWLRFAVPPSHRRGMMQIVRYLTHMHEQKLLRHKKSPPSK